VLLFSKRVVTPITAEGPRQS